MTPPYEVLGVARGASSDDVKKAYRKLAMKYHFERSVRQEKDVVHINGPGDFDALFRAHELVFVFFYAAWNTDDPAAREGS